MKKVVIPTKLDAICKTTLEANGKYTVVHVEGADLLELAKEHADAYALVVRSNKVTPEVIDAYPDLKVVIRAGAGYNTIDIKAARARGIDVMNTPGANSNAVAEEVIALILAHARHLLAADASCREGKWEKSSFMGSELTGKTLGILGLGHIGQLLVRRASGFDIRALAYDPFVSQTKAENLGVTLTDVDTIFREADFISLHIPENDATRGMVNARLFDLMKPGAVIINCARSGVLNESDLREVRKTKDIFLLNDVYPKDEAGPKPIHDIADIMLPHLGASTVEANRNAALFAANQLIDFDEKGIATAVVNRDTPEGLDPQYALLTHTLAKVCRAVHGAEATIKSIDCSYYGDLKDHADWLVTPLAAAVHCNFEPGMGPKKAIEYLKDQGIVYASRDPDDTKGYGESITIDMTGHLDGAPHETSIRGTITEGHIMVSRINHFEKLYIDPTAHTIGFIYDDSPGILGKIGNLLGENGINIDDVRNPHDADNGKTSLALLKVNQPVEQPILDCIASAINARTAFYVKT